MFQHICHQLSNNIFSLQFYATGTDGKIQNINQKLSIFIQW